MIDLTEKAISKLKEISDSEGIGFCSIRVKYVAGGCAGSSFDLDFDNGYREDLDFKIEIGGVKVIVDQIAIHYLEGCVIDYIENGFSEGFKFNVPKAITSCGCNSSFSF